MEFKDIADIIHTGGQGALLLIVWIVWLGAKRISIAIDTLEEIRAALVTNGVESTKSHVDILDKLDKVHDNMIALPLNILRVNKK